MAEVDLKMRKHCRQGGSGPLSRPITTANATIPAAPLVLIDVVCSQGVTGRSYLFGYTLLVLRPLVAIIDNLGELLGGSARAVRAYDSYGVFVEGTSEKELEQSLERGVRGGHSDR